VQKEAVAKALATAYLFLLLRGSSGQRKNARPVEIIPPVYLRSRRHSAVYLPQFRSFGRGLTTLLLAKQSRIRSFIR